MVKRGPALREHILWTAKDVLLEFGFERSSMDMVAARAGTTKRSLYAHFPSKTDLFHAAIDLVRTTFLRRLKKPEQYSADPIEALTLFCGRYLEILLHKGSIQLCRASMAESDRFGEQAAQCFEMLFTQVAETLGDYLTRTFDLSEAEGAASGRMVLGQLLYPRFPRALFGIDVLAPRFGEDAMAPDFDLAPVRAAIVALVAPLRLRDAAPVSTTEADHLPKTVNVA